MVTASETFERSARLELSREAEAQQESRLSSALAGIWIAVVAVALVGGLIALFLGIGS